jgi:FG-GAP-like repeat
VRALRSVLGLVSVSLVLWIGCSSSRGDPTSCAIGGALIPDGTLNGQNPCQTCDARGDPLAWSNVSSGIQCGPGGGTYCSGGTCSAGCYIDATFYPPRALSPTNGCLACQPPVSPTVWTAVTGPPPKKACPPGAACDHGRCQPGCSIGATVYPAGTANPDNFCQNCRPEQQASAWTDQPPGAPCADGGAVCADGICTAGCDIEGVFYSPGGSSPETACETCQPGLSTSTFSPVTGPAPGGTCGSGSYCFKGRCSGGCSIDGASYAPGDPDPENACQGCVPIRSATTWSDLDPGTPCGVGVCRGGACLFGCEIGGVLFPANTTNPANICQSCSPAESPDAWSPLTWLPPAGCVGGQVCADGGCRAGCYIDKAFQAPGGRRLGDDSQCCSPSKDPSAWSAAFDAGPTLDPFPGNIYSSQSAYGATRVAAADFNGDGRRDLSFLTNDLEALAIVLVQADGGLGSPALRAGFSPTSLATGDLDGDGYPDLVTADDYGRVSVLMGLRADGGFGRVVRYASNIAYLDAGPNDAGLNPLYDETPSGVGLSSVTLADVNRDGTLDVVVSSGRYSTTVGILLGIGDGGLRAGTAVASGAYSTFLVEAADFNGDGAPDLLVVGDTAFSATPVGGPRGISISTHSPGMNLLLNDGTGSFGPPIVIAAGMDGGIQTFTVADFNSDGTPDIAAEGSSPSWIQVFMGIGDGGFQPPATYPISLLYGAATGQLVVGDFNGDGHPDLLLLATSVMLLNRGDGTFSVGVNGLGIYGESGIAVDFNGDGFDDLAVETGGVLQLWFNNCH